MDQLKIALDWCLEKCDDVGRAFIKFNSQNQEVVMAAAVLVAVAGLIGKSLPLILAGIIVIVTSEVAKGGE